MTTSGENELLAYRSFWEENLQKVEEIASHLEKNLLSLEKKHKTEQEQYKELERLLNFLLSIYSSYNCLKGREYLLKLKACLNGYSGQTQDKTARFDVLHFLLAKAKEQTAEGFKEFPCVTHEYRDELTQKKIEGKATPLPFHWITFRTSAQWFVAAYDELRIIESAEAVTREETPGKETIVYDGISIPIGNLPTRHSRSGEPIRFYLIITISGMKNCYAASETGKRISASKNVIAPRLKEYSLVRKKYIRLFGKNHIFINT